MNKHFLLPASTQSQASQYIFLPFFVLIYSDLAFHGGEEELILKIAILFLLNVQ